MVNIYCAVSGGYNKDHNFRKIANFLQQLSSFWPLLASSGLRLPRGLRDGKWRKGWLAKYIGSAQPATGQLAAQVALPILTFALHSANACYLGHLRPESRTGDSTQQTEKLQTNDQ